MILLVATAFVLPQLPPTETEYQGYLTPDKLPSPPNDCDPPKGALSIYFGNAAISYAPPDFRRHVIIRIGQKDLLWLTHADSGINVSVKFFDSEGILATINDGKFKQGEFITFDNGEGTIDLAALVKNIQDVQTEI